jgi:Flp pilus assembly protein TadD
MNPKKMLTVRLGVALLMAGTVLGTAAQAQTGASASSQFGPNAALTRHLKTIADQPRNVGALLGAGKAALELGDPQAALTFFARAEEIAPRDGRIKAAMGSAFVQMEQTAPALQFFSEAAGLGIPAAEFAGDRGLAYDLTGDPRRAQADYVLSLSRQENAEVRRRLALSLAISGERDKALATIDSQVRAHDRSAWRVRTFILALTGDAAGATQSAQAVMPAQAAQMQPFFAALPALNPAERAMAVHFGHFPSDGKYRQPPVQNTQYASAAPAVVAAQQKPQPRSNSRSRASERTSSRDSRTDEASTRRPTAREERYGWTGRAAPRSREDRNTRLAANRVNTPVAGAGATAQAVTPPAMQQPQQQAMVAPQQPVRQSLPTQQPVYTPPVQQSPVYAPPVQQQAIAAPQQPVRQNVPTQQPVYSPPRQAPIFTPPAQQQPVVVAQNPAFVPPAQQSPQPQVSSPSVSNPLQSVNSAPGFSLGAVQSAAVQPPAQSGVQVASVTAPAPVPTTAAPVSVTPSEQADRASGLAAIAAAIESLPVEEPKAAPKQAEKPATQLALNTATKPVYGPKFETPQAEPKKAEPKKTEPVKAAPKKDEAKSAAAKKDDEATKSAASKKEQSGKSASAKKDEDDAKSSASKKEQSGKSASAKKDEDDAKSAASKKEQASKSASAKKEEPKAKEPSRHWVQVAGGANEAAMTREFLRLKSKAPKLLGAHTAWTTPLRATNRLLVGPFKSAGEAQDFVNELAKLDLSAFSWTSPAGQEIVKLASK